MLDGVFILNVGSHGWVFGWCGTLKNSKLLSVKRWNQGQIEWRARWVEKGRKSRGFGPSAN